MTHGRRLNGSAPGHRLSAAGAFRSHSLPRMGKRSCAGRCWSTSPTISTTTAVLRLTTTPPTSKRTTAGNGSASPSTCFSSLVRPGGSSVRSRRKRYAAPSACVYPCTSGGLTVSVAFGGFNYSVLTSATVQLQPTRPIAPSTA
jgi:hypothetical protein